MNARRRAQPDGLPSRVYAKSGAYYWVRHDNKWIKLSRVDEGDRRMFERLAEEKRKFEPSIGAGNLSKLVGEFVDLHKSAYAETYRDEWVRRGDVVASYFRDWNVELMDASAIEDFVTGEWPGKLSSQRAMKAWVSKFFNWLVVKKKLLKINPAREVKVKKPKVRTVYIPDAAFLAIRDALMVSKPHPKTGKQSKVQTGPMMQCFIDLCYLTAQRSTEIRNLRWNVDEGERFTSSYIDRESGVIHFLPSKTEDSSGEMVDWPITPEIEAVLDRARKLDPAFGQTYVIRDKHGKPKTDQACRDAWEGAMDRCGLDEAPYTIKDIRAKALTDAKKAGYDIDALQVAGAHTDRSTTEGYIKSREVPVSTVRLALPVKKSA
ncbi:MAG: tyrosine-type recombinase/integrase [Paraburkholderia sp.]|uniref:tyrosine-type recombinase/integrase n=1 Tax=Paraburkholderia sp. TaxID=1926495 RepID=UPI003C69A8A0